MWKSSVSIQSDMADFSVLISASVEEERISEMETRGMKQSK